MELWLGGRLATMDPTMAGPYGAIEDGAIAVDDGRIAWIGRAADLPGELPPRATARHDLAGRWVTPGLIDCHTHLVYGGDRAAEFELRLSGATYEQIARAGGGIRSTVKATRAADADSLFASARDRLKPLLAEGVTGIEIKSGYGLDRETELRMLRVARRLGNELPVTVHTSFLGAHTVPPEFDGKADAYIDFLISDVLPAVSEAGLADSVDAFCETIGFTLLQTKRLFEAAAARGLPVRLHAEQLSDMKGAVLASRFKALSADHLEWLEADGVAALAASGTVAVLLPGAYYFLRETRLPPIAALRQAGVPIAIATDCNPGSSPVTSLLLMLSMACTLFRLTPGEALAGVTRHAAKALALEDSHGTLSVGKAADFAIWDIERPAELAYRIGFNPLYATVRAGRSTAG
jgi:imidazolonepropionase